LLKHVSFPLATRGLLALALAGSAAVGLVAAPAASAVGEVTPATVADLDAQVARTVAELTEGSRRLEEGEARLVELQAREAAADAAAQAAADRAGAARLRLGDMVGAQYRNPEPGIAALVLGSGADGFSDAVRGLVSLEQVRGNQQDTLAEAEGQRRVADQLAAEADRLAADAVREKDALAAQVAELGARAQAANDQLAQAAAALQAENDARAAAEARASRDRAPAVAPPPAAVVLAGGAVCGGGNVSGYPNGMLPLSALCPLNGTNGLVLRADAAAAFNRMAAAGGMPCAGNSYRSYAEQVALYRIKPNLAAVPGTSNHGWGVAVDFACGAESFGTAAYQWLKANGPTYGWTHPSWAEPGGSRPEPWHWEYTG
jgi:hypothetical protein